MDLLHKQLLDTIGIKLEQIIDIQINSPMLIIKYTDLITKLHKISEELTGLVNNIKEDQ